MSGRAKVKAQYCQHWEQQLDSNLFVTLPWVIDGLHRASAWAGGDALPASALANIFDIIARVTEAGMSACMSRFSRPGIIMERFLCSALSPSEAHCSGFIGFIGMVSGVRASLASTGVSVGPAGTTVTCTPRGFSSI